MCLSSYKMRKRIEYKWMKIRIVFVLLLLAPCAHAQQEVQLSQYMFNGLTLNPALAGSHEALNVQLLYRMQWQGFEGAPRSEVGSVDGVITQSNSMGWGLSVMGEQVGLMKTLGAYASYSYRMRLNQLDDRLSFGLSVGAMQEAFGGITTGRIGNNGQPLYDVGDDVLAPETRWRPDFRVGAYYNYGKIAYAGISASNLGTFLKLSADTLYLYDPHIYLNGGMHYYLDDKWKLSPSLLACYTLNDNPTVDGNVAVSYNDKVWVGVGMRMVVPISGKQTSPLNALAIMAEVWVTPSLRLGYCYDYAMSRLSGVQNGSHEVSLGFTLTRKVSVARDPKNFK
jgi:type IX secretion system PorP/SprF family membrane protein